MNTLSLDDLAFIAAAKLNNIDADICASNVNGQRSNAVQYTLTAQPE